MVFTTIAQMNPFIVLNKCILLFLQSRIQNVDQICIFIVEGHAHFGYTQQSAVSHRRQSHK